VSVASVRAGAGGRRQIVFTLSAEASVEAEVVNIAGRPIRTVVTGYAAPAGINTLAWDGRSETGALVPNGTYLLRIIARTDAGAQTEATAACNVTR
jgi:flagellar hook assembly protein FlgD